jgi:hypothetical protein
MRPFRLKKIFQIKEERVIVIFNKNQTVHIENII